MSPRPRPLPVLPAELATDERRVLVEFLEQYRAVLARKAEGLDRDQLNRTVGASPLTLAALIKHLALVEDVWFTERLAGAPLPEPWAGAPFDDDPDWDLHSAAGDEPADLLALLDAACGRSRAVLDGVASLDAVAHPSEAEAGRGPWTLRWILVHMIEEYARHAGHADLLREAVDGRTGD